MDEASVQALQEIEQELLELRRERERMLAQAYRDEQGRRIFMTEDESAAYYEDGSQVATDEFAQIKDQLRGKPSWDALQGSHHAEEQLHAERDQIHAHDADRQELREDLKQGAISQEEAEQREGEIAASLPERVRYSYKAPDITQAEDNAMSANAELSADEMAAAEVRTAPVQEPTAVPAAGSRNPGAPSL